MLRRALIALSLLSPGLGHAQTGLLQKSVVHNGQPHKYVLYVPTGYDPQKPMPTIVFLHGLGETGADGWKQVAVGLGPAILLNAEKWNFLVLFPQRPPSTDNVFRAWGALEPMLLGMIEQTKRDYKVDTSRLYLTGLSMGGFGTWELAAKHPKLFAAIAPVCGGGDPATAVKLKDLPIWCFHGDQDRAVPVERSQQMIDAVKAAGGNPKFTIYPGVGHNSWDNAYRNEKLYEWFLQFTTKP